MWLPGPFFVMAVDFLRLAAGKRVYMHASPSAAGKLQVFRQQRKNPEYMHETPLPGGVPMLYLSHFRKNSSQIIDCMPWTFHCTHPQLKQDASSITAQLSSTWMALAVQVFSQMPQPIQLTAQTPLASLPLSLLEHLTAMVLAQSCKWMMC